MHGMTLAPPSGSPLSGDEVTVIIDAVRARFRDWARRCPAKSMARTFGVPVKTVDRWREGVMPSPDSLTLIAARMGEHWLTWLFGPALGEAGIDGRIATLTAELESVREDIARREHETGMDRAAAGDRGPHGGVSLGLRRVASGRGPVVASTFLIGLLAGAMAMQVVGDADDVLLRAATGQARGQAKVMRAVGVRDV